MVEGAVRFRSHQQCNFAENKLKPTKMEIKHYEWENCQIHSFFTGGHYFFFSDWCGVFAVANRDYEYSEQWTDENGNLRNKERFELVFGNEHLHDNAWLKKVKSEIKSCEQKHIPTEVEFVVNHEDLSTKHLKISLV